MLMTGICLLLLQLCPGDCELGVTRKAHARVEPGTRWSLEMLNVSDALALGKEGRNRLRPLHPDARADHCHIVVVQKKMKHAAKLEGERLRSKP